MAAQILAMRLRLKSGRNFLNCRQPGFEFTQYALHIDQVKARSQHWQH